MNSIWILRFGKNKGVGWLETENKLRKNKKIIIKETSLKYQYTGLMILGQLRVSRVIFSR